MMLDTKKDRSKEEGGFCGYSVFSFHSIGHSSEQEHTVRKYSIFVL